VFLVFRSVPAWAQPKTDVVALANGDRITGEIMKFSRGRLELKTDDAGTINIEWDNILKIESPRQFEVETSDGRRLLGSLSPAAGARTIEITNPGAVTTLPMQEIARITPIGARFWARLEGSVDAGFSYTRSSGIAQTNLNGDVRYRRPAFVVLLGGSATFTKQDANDEPDDRSAIELSYARYRGPTWFVSGATRFESNESLGLRLRSQLGGLIGRRLINTNKAQLEFAGGIVGNDEQGVDAEATQNVEGVLSFTWSRYSYDGPKTNADFGIQYYPSLSNWGRQRIQLDTSVKRDFWKDIGASVNFYFTFDSEPPNPAAARSDLGLTLSLSWTF
jgi:putative salt-induced outer membrane protein YdiY